MTHRQLWNVDPDIQLGRPRHVADPDIQLGRPRHVADPDIQLGRPRHVADSDIRLGGHFNMFPSISCLFFRWTGAKVYIQTGWGSWSDFPPGSAAARMEPV